MITYIQFAYKAFQRNMVYRFDYLLGILNTCLQIFIFVTIWKTLYSNQIAVDGVTLSMVTTNFIISLGLSNAFQVQDQAVQWKINDGTIVNELLKPVSYTGYLLADNLGNVFFRLITNFTPALILAVFTIGMLPPNSLMNMIFFLVSIVLGFFVLWQISFIVQMSAFWVINVWSVSTIKNVFVNILSGAMLPLWFMPSYIKNFIQFTPFDSIFFTPVKLYLGQIATNEIAFIFLRQLFWIIILYTIGTIMWNFGKRKLIVQGG